MAPARPLVRLALLGAGMAGKAHAHAFRNLPALFHPLPADVRLVVVVDPIEPLARDLAERYGFERVATSWEAAADASDVDAAIVALPNHEHRKVVEALVETGKHVLCEKPLAPTAKDSWALLQAASRAGAVHGVNFNYKRAPAIAAIKRALDRGDLGEPRQLIGSYLTDYALSADVPLTWRYQRALAGGGALLDVGPHIVDTARYLIGDIAVVQGAVLETFVKKRPLPIGHVVGHDRGTAAAEHGEVDTDDVASFTVRFQSGVVGQIGVSRIATGHRNSFGFTLIGARGAATFDFERAPEFSYFDASRDDDLNGFRRVVTGPLHPYAKDVLVMPVAGVGHGIGETFIAQAYEFVRAVVQGTPLSSSGFEEGYAAALVCEAVQRAAEQGRAVSIQEVKTQVESGIV